MRDTECFGVSCWIIYFVLLLLWGLPAGFNLFIFYYYYFDGEKQIFPTFTHEGIMFCELSASTQLKIPCSVCSHLLSFSLLHKQRTLIFIIYTLSLRALVQSHSHSCAKSFFVVNSIPSVCSKDFTAVIRYWFNIGMTHTGCYVQAVLLRISQESHLKRCDYVAEHVRAMSVWDASETIWIQSEV